MNIILYYLLRRFFVRLRFERGFIILEKGLLLRRRAVMPLSAVTVIEIRRTPLLRLIYAKKVTVSALSGKIGFYLKKNESLPFLPKNGGIPIRPSRSSVFFGAFVDTRALSGMVLFSATIYRVGKFFGGSYFDDILSAIAGTARELSRALELLHIAVPRAAAVTAVFVLTAWGFAFFMKLFGMAGFRVRSRGGYITVKRGLITLYEQVVVLNNLDAAVSCNTVTTIAARRAPLYARGIMIFPPVGEKTSRRLVKTLCGLPPVRGEEIKPPLKGLLGHCAVPLGWFAGFAAALIIVWAARHMELIPSAELIRVLLWYGLAASAWAVLAYGLYWKYSGMAADEDIIKMTARRGTRLYGGIIPKRAAVRDTAAQNIFQRRSGLCDFTITLYGKQWFKLRNIKRGELES